MTLFTIDKITEKDGPRPSARRYQPYRPAFPTYGGLAPHHPGPLPVSGPSGQQRWGEGLNSAGGNSSVSPGVFSASSSSSSSEAGSPEPVESPPSVNDKNKGTQSDEHKKPPHSYIALIAMAILDSPERRLLLCDIYQYIQENFPFYRNNDRSWRNSIRHNLSLNECFIKYGRSGDGRGNFWAVHPANVEDFSRGDFHRRRARRRVRASDMLLHGYPVYHHPYAAGPAPPGPPAGYPVPLAATPLGFVPMTVTTLPPPYPAVSAAVYPPSGYPAPGYPVPTLNPLLPLVSTPVSPVATQRPSSLSLVKPSTERVPAAGLPSFYPSTQPSYLHPPSTTQPPFHHSPTSTAPPLARYPPTRYPPTTLGLAPPPGYGYPTCSQPVITSPMGSYQTDSTISHLMH